MTLMYLRGGYLYEHRPDLIPHGRMTALEVELWDIFYREQAKRHG